MSSEKKETSGKAIDRDLIKDLAGLLNETDLSEIEVESHGLRVRVARNISVQTMAAPMAAPPAPAAAAPAPAPGAEAPKATSAHAGAVNSPMVGTAYAAPEPGAAPFVKEGDTVREGQTLMIVEAMKTMNPIPAPKAGKITQILVSDGQPVEYGEPLLVIE